MFNYDDFKSKINVWKHKQLFWIIMIFTWYLFLLWWLGLLSIKDIKNSIGKKPIYKSSGFYGLIFIALIILFGISAQNLDTSDTNSLASSKKYSKTKETSEDIPKEFSDSKVSKSSSTSESKDPLSESSSDNQSDESQNIISSEDISESKSIVNDQNSKSESIAQSQDTSTETNNDDIQTDSGQQIVGNIKSHIYHVPGQANYHMNADNATYFNSETDAQAAGYRKAER